MTEELDDCVESTQYDEKMSENWQNIRYKVMCMHARKKHEHDRN